MSAPRSAAGPGRPGTGLDADVFGDERGAGRRTSAR